MTRSCCVDSSVIVSLLVPEPLHERAAALFDQINLSGQIVYLPAFAWAEVGSVLRRKVRQGQIGRDHALHAWRLFRALPMIRYVQTDEILDRAWELAESLELATLYDASFLVVTEWVSDHSSGACEFWTADEDLIARTAGKLEYVRHV